MNTIHSSPIQERGYGKGYIVRLAALMLGAAFFLSAAVSTAKADSMTQLEYIQTLVALSGDNLGPNPSPADYVNWARARGLNPDGGWQPDAQLSKNVVAQTFAQLLNIVPRKNIGNYVALLAQNGIHVPNANLISRADLTEFIDGGIADWMLSYSNMSPSHGRPPGAGEGRPDQIPPTWSNGQGKGPGNVGGGKTHGN